MSKKIKSKQDLLASQFACILPWMHAHILPDSTVLPCCDSDFKIPYGKTSEKSLHEVWNDKPFNEMRLKMLADKAVKSCAHCYELEAGGMESMRQRMNRDFSHHADLLDQTTDKGKFEAIKMRYMDTRFSNLCNFKCRGCSPFCSSQWYDDYEALWGVKLNEDKLVNLAQVDPNSPAELDEHLSTLEVAYFAGGEPLMMDEHYYCLEKLIELKKDVPIHYNTNLSVLKFKKYNLIELWQKFSSIDLNISLDDIEARGEYFRHGLNWEKFKQNILKVKNELPHARFQITCTITLFNIQRIPEIHSTMMKFGLIDEYGFTLNPLLDPVYYRAQVLPQADKEKIEKKLLDYASKLDELYPGKKWDSFKQALAGVIGFMHKADMTHELTNFKNITTKLDEVRNESFENTFPEIAHLIMRSILVVIPIRNQAVRIQPLMRAIEQDILPECKEVFFIDENSTDNSLHVLNLELPKLKNPHKLLRMDRDVTRGESFKIALDYARQNHYDYILTFNEGWQDCLVEYLSIIRSKEFLNYDLIVGKRGSKNKNIGHLIDFLSNALTSLAFKRRVDETKGDAINLHKVSALADTEILNSHDYIYPILLNQLKQGKNVCYTATDNGINFRSTVRLNLKRLFFVLKSLYFAGLKKLKT